MATLHRVRRTKTTSQRIYQQLAKAIGSNELLPGEALVEDSLAHQLGVSRTPIREALLMLEREGLAEVLDGKGVFVKSLELKDLLEVFEFREAIELHAVERVVARIPSTELTRWRKNLEAVREPNTTLQIEAAAEADLAFHRRLVALINNTRMLQTWDRLAVQLRRFWIDGRTVPGRAGTDVEECLRILDFIERGRSSEAIMALKRHLKSTKQALVAWREKVSLQKNSDPH